MTERDMTERDITERDVTERDMTETVSRVLVVGASLGGLSVVDALRRAGSSAEVVVVERATQLPTDRPPLSKQVARGETTPDDHPLLVAARLDELDVDLRLGVTAANLDIEERTVGLSTGEQLSGDAIVIATGAMPRRLPVPGADADDVLVLRDAADARLLATALRTPRRVVVVGCGFIGAEVAASAAATGHTVTVFEAGDTPLQRVLPAAIGEWVRRRLTDRGIHVVTSASVSEVQRERDATVSAVALADGSSVAADLVVVGIGAAPDIEWLRSSGLTLDNGVVCDDRLRAAPGVYAVGDVANAHNRRVGRRLRVEQWENAVEQGTFVGGLLAGSHSQPYRALPYFWSDIFDSKLQLAGDPAPDDAVVVVDGSLDDDRFVALFRRGDICSGVVGVGRPRQVIKARMALADADADGLPMRRALDVAGVGG